MSNTREKPEMPGAMPRLSGGVCLMSERTDRAVIAGPGGFGESGERVRASAVCILAILGLAAASSLQAAIQFEDRTDIAGPFGATESWGLAAGDVNGDGWTDLFLNNHRQRPAVFLNEGNAGRFSDITLTVDKSDTWVTNPISDQHGAGWADFDNDGDQDLWIATGTCCDAQFMVNHGGYFTDEAIVYDVAEDGSGRGVNWVDFSGDGYLDAIANTFSLSKAKQQTPLIDFVNKNQATGLECGPRTDWIHIADFDTDGSADLLCTPASSTKLYDITPYAASGAPFTDISSLLPQFGLAPDSAAADFDNNLQVDIFVLNGELRRIGADITDAAGTRIEALFDVAKSAPDSKGFTFQGGEQVTFTVDSQNYSLNRILIGGVGGYNPVSPTFTLDSTDPSVQYDGTINHDPAFGRALYIAFNTVTNTWEVSGYSHDLSSVRAYITVENLGVTAFSNVQTVGAGPADEPQRPSLLINQDGTFTDEKNSRGFSDPISCVSVVHGDFDNDADLDLYLVCRDAVMNIENLLYENDGNGVFTLVPGAGGASGPVGSAVGDGAGTGESVVVADFDADGFLDLFVANGLNLQPGKIGGPNQFFRNSGNANAWIELDLVATGSSIDAIGAKVFVTTPDGLTQLREQDHGYHRWSQNDKRIHFGLGANATVSSLVVEWPSGEVNEFTNVAAGSIYRVTEGAGGLANGVLEVASPGAVATLPGPKAGDECGQPLFNHDFGSNILVWKDCTSNLWHVRAQGGRRKDARTEYVGAMIGDQAIPSVTPINLTYGDIVDSSAPNQVLFTLGVWYNNEEGFDLDATGLNELCLELEAPTETRVLVGAGRWPVEGAFDLISMSPCLPRLAVSDVSIDEAAGSATVTVSLSGSSESQVTVDYATADDTASAGLDYTAASGQAVIEAGELSTSFVVPIADDAALEGDETFLVTLDNPANALLGQASATVTILDDDDVACAAPSYDAASEPGVFLWRDCDAPGPDQVWQLRVTGGGSPTTITYAGVVSATEALSVVGMLLEPNDELDSVPGDAIVDYLLMVGGGGQDGYQLTVPATAEACFAVDVLPAGATVQVGADRQVVSAPFALSTLGSCAPVVTVSDVSVDEAAGSATVTLSLSASSGSQVTVDYATADDTAIAGQDYTAASGQALIDAGELSTSFVVPIANDVELEGDETFLVTLDNPANALLGQASATVTILDDDDGVCGMPSYNQGTEVGVFLWRDCDAPGPDQVWQLRVTGGGSPSTITYAGVVSTTEVLGVAGFSIESNDVLDSVTGDLLVDYHLKVIGGGQDGYQLTVPATASVCFGADTLPAGATVQVGADRQVVSAPFALSTLGSCAPVVTVSDVSVDEAAGSATVTLSLSASSGSQVTVDYATADDTAIAGQDYTAASGQALIDAGELSTSFVVPIANDVELEGDETFLVTLDNPANALLGQASATVTILDDDDEACGMPSYNQGTEVGVFLWRDCDAPGPDQVWQLRVTGGGSPSTITYAGVVRATDVLGVAGFSIEGNDVLDTVTGDLLVDYHLKVIGGGQDGYQLTVPATASVCFGADTLPAGAMVQVGADRLVLGSTFELATLQACSF